METGQLEVICGGMFSGKTEELLRRLKRSIYARQKVQAFKPRIDQRYSEDCISTHDSIQLPSIVVDSVEEILRNIHDQTRVIGIDEVQFFSSEIVAIAQRLADRGIRVILAGLDMDYRGMPFGPMPTLLAVADSVTKLSAVCVSCGKAATRTQKLFLKNQSETDGSNPIEVGGTEQYEARCRVCHEPRATDFEQQLSFAQVGRNKNDRTQTQSLSY